MKHFLAVGIIAASCCAVANAQILYTNTLLGATLIYSNGFGGGAVTISNTAPDYASNVYGGYSTSLWIQADSGTADVGTLQANGYVTSIVNDTWLLPFKATNNQVYTLSATVDWSGGNPGSWMAAGFAQLYTTGLGASAFNSSLNGYDWSLANYASSIQWFAGPSTGSGTTVNGVFSQNPTGNHTMMYILDTTTNENSSNKWTIACFVDGVQRGNNFTYSSNPTIGSLGVAQHSMSNPSLYHWTAFSLCAAQLAIIEQPTTTNVNQGSVFTNTVMAGGTPTFYYQWYYNTANSYAGAVAMTNTSDGRIYGTTNASLIFTNVHASDAGYYFAVITNALVANSLANTSSISPLGVYGPPFFATEYPNTNSITVYAGASPQFSVTTGGKQPITLQWYTNSHAWGGQTNGSITLTNVQSATTVYCTANNSVGANTSMVWTASVTAADTAPFPTEVLALAPLAYWPLNEPDCCSGSGPNDGVVAVDYAGGNNGTYTNVILGYTGYSTSDPSDTSALLGSYSASDAGAFSIAGINFGAPAGNSPAFSVQAWVNGSPFQTSGAGIISEGYQGSEQFSLDVTSDEYRFLVRDASGNSYSAQAPYGPSGNWDFVVGVCDEVNGAVSLYVNGERAASISIHSGAGLLSSTNPVTIGTRCSSPTANYDLQFRGSLDAVGVYSHALTYTQVLTLWESVPGNTVPPYFVAPLAPANVVYLAGTNLLIPATVAGDTPVGYYWSNTTTTAVMGSGSTSVPGTFLNANLTIPDASTNLSGDVLELVATNAAGSSNLFFTLFTPPAPPPPLDYTNNILYSNDFDGPGITINGTRPSLVNTLVGDTNTVWICTYTNSVLPSNGTVYANGSLGTNSGSALLPFVPEPGFIYTMTASLTALSGMGNWVTMGFAQSAEQMASPAGTRFTDTPYNGYAWLYVQNTTAFFEEGPRTAGSVQELTGVPLPSSTPVNLEIDLNTETNEAWTVSAFVNGIQVGTNYVYTNPPPIAYVGICQNQFSAGGSIGISWDSWALTEEGTNVPPYVLPPQLPTNVTVWAGSTLTIPATAFGWAPLGYSWSNTNAAAVLASGLTNTLPPLADAPLPSTLTVPNVPANWNGDQLALTLTNAFGTNTTLVSLTVLTQPTLQIALTNGQVTVSWPSADIGLWTLQAHTNSLVGPWVNVPNSTSTNQMTFPVNPANSAVFYRLYYP